MLKVPVRQEMSERDPYAARKKNQTVEGRIDNRNEQGLTPNRNLKNAEEEVNASGAFKAKSRRSGSPGTGAES